MDDPVTLRVGIVTVSDRAARGEYEDRSGPAVRDYLTGVITCDWEDVARVVPDERAELESVLMELCDDEGCALVVTTGGTGPAPRDVTPDATEAVCHTLLPGFGEAMRAVSRDSVPTAILSRQTAGVRGRTLIVNLPGSPRAIEQCLRAVLGAIPDCLDLIGAAPMEVDPGLVSAPRMHLD